MSSLRARWVLLITLWVGLVTCAALSAETSAIGDQATVRGVVRWSGIFPVGVPRFVLSELAIPPKSGPPNIYLDSATINLEQCVGTNRNGRGRMAFGFHHDRRAIHRLPGRFRDYYELS